MSRSLNKKLLSMKSSSGARSTITGTRFSPAHKTTGGKRDDLPVLHLILQKMLTRLMCPKSLTKLTSPMAAAATGTAKRRSVIHRQRLGCSSGFRQ
jgi:hypothetical protein